MNNEVESYIGELKELRKLKESLTKQNEELKYEVNTLRDNLNIVNNKRKRRPTVRKPTVFSSTDPGLS